MNSTTTRFLRLRTISVCLALTVVLLQTSSSVPPQSSIPTPNLRLLEQQRQDIARLNNLRLLAPGDVALGHNRQPVVALTAPIGKKLLQLSNGKSVEISETGTYDVRSTVPGFTTYVPNSASNVTQVTSTSPTDTAPIQNITAALEERDHVAVITRLRFDASKSDQPFPSYEEGLNMVAKASSMNLGKLPATEATIDAKLPLIGGLAMTVTESGYQALLHDPDVLSITLDDIAHTTLASSVADIGATTAWTQPTSTQAALTGGGTRIAVLDTGVDYTHPDLGNCHFYGYGSTCKVIGGYDFVNADADPMDDNGHGTHVAATAAGYGTSDSTSLFGVAPDAKILAYKVCNSAGGCYNSHVVTALGYAVDPNQDGNTSDHVEVATLSLGGAGNPDDPMSLAVDAATAAGVVVTVSAGNTGPGTGTIQSPGNARTAITVGASCLPGQLGVQSHCAGSIADFSSRGPYTWNSIDLQKPDVVAPGVDVCAAKSQFWNISEGEDCLDSSHKKLSGTSMAAPHVAGLAALIKQQHPEYTPAQVKTLLRSSATSLNGQSVNAQGAGKVNAIAALSLNSAVSVSSAPWVVITNPTQANTVVQRTFSVTATDGSISTLTPSAIDFPNGCTLGSSPSSLTVSGLGTASYTATLTISNSTQFNGTYFLRIGLSSDGQLKYFIPIIVELTPTLIITPSPTSLIDFGLDTPNNSTWNSGTQSLTIQNLRTDASRLVSFSYGGSGFPFAVTMNAPAGFTTVPANSQVTVDVSLDVLNGGLSNGLYYGHLVVNASLGSRFYSWMGFAKYYRVQVDLQSSSVAPQFTVNDISHQTMITTTSPVVYLNTTGPFDIMIDELAPGAYRHVLKPNVTLTNGQATITYNNTTDAPHHVTMTGKKADGTPNSWSLMMRYLIYPATSEVGGALQITTSPNLTSLNEYYSDIPSDWKIVTQAIMSDEDHPSDWYVYHLPILNGLTNDLAINYKPSDYHMAENVLDLGDGANRTSSGWQFGLRGSWAKVLPFSPYPTKTMKLYTTIPNDDLQYSGVYGAISEWFPTDCVNGVCPSVAMSPFFSLGSSIARWQQVSPNQFTSYQPINPLPSTTTALSNNAIGPLLWFGKFSNQATTLRYIPYYGEFTPFLRQDFALATIAAPAYTVKNATNQTVTSGTIASTITTNFHMAVTNEAWHYKGNPDSTASLGSANEYHFLATVPYVFHGQSMTASLDATMDTRRSDMNPPSLTQFQYTVDGARSDMYTTGSTNHLWTTFDAVGGSIQSVQYSYSTDGSNFTTVATTSENGGYGADVPTNLASTIVTMRFLATDVAGNSLQYTWQMPRGASPMSLDDSGPMVLLRSPDVNGILPVNADVTLTSESLDNVGVTRVDYLLDGAVVASSNVAPFSTTFDPWNVSTGAHTIAAKAYDAAGNSTISWAVPVTKPTTAISFPFSAGTDIDAWTSSGGAWSSAGGALTPPPTWNATVSNWLTRSHPNSRVATSILLGHSQQQAGIHLLASDATHGYICRPDLSTSPHRLVIERRDGGTTTTLAHRIIGTLDHQAWYSIQAQVTNNTVQCSIWLRSDAEPAAWLLSTTDATYFTGQSGVFAEQTATAPQPIFGPTTFLPSALGDVADQTIFFASATATNSESVTTATITVLSSGTSQQSMSAQYAITGGTATPNVDVLLQSGTITIPAGETSATIPLTILNDTLHEQNETVIVTLSSPSGATLADPSAFTYTIEDTDAAPQLSFGQSTLTMTESQTTRTVPLGLSTASGLPVTATVHIVGGTATTGQDFLPPVTTITISAGATNAMFGIPILADDFYEPDETIILELSNPQGASLAEPQQITLTLRDSGDQPQAHFLSPMYTFDESTRDIEIPVELSTATSQTVILTYSFDKNLVDYPLTLTSAPTLQFAAGETIQHITLHLEDDAVYRGDAIATLALTDATDATLGTASRSTINIRENETIERLATSISVVRTAAPSQKSTATFTTANTGTRTSLAPVLTVRLPAGLKALTTRSGLARSWVCQMVRGVQTCSVTMPSLPPGARRSVTMSVQLSATQPASRTSLPLRSTVRSRDGVVVSAAASILVRLTVTVRGGDTLQTLARRYYGSAQSWTTLRQRNITKYPKLKSAPYRLRVGWQLNVW